MTTVKAEHRAARHHGGHQAVPTARSPRLPGLWHFATEYLLLLPAGAAIALTWANLAPESYFTVAFALDFLVNDVLMVLFFGLIMKEVAEATAPGGVLHPWRRTTLPLIAALGLAVVPALAFMRIVPLFDEPRVLEGWPAVVAVDLALGYFVARVIFGRHPVIPFFVLLAICANGLSLFALAMVGATTPTRFGIAVALMMVAMATAMTFRRVGGRRWRPYVLAAGGLSWGALYVGGFEPALALVPIVPFLPHARRDPGFFVDASPRAHDALSQFEREARHPAQVALFLFGLVNAGVPFTALDSGTWALPLTALIGKPLGLLFGVGVALAFGLHLPHRVGWRELAVVGCISTIGFTMALFVAASALGPGPALSALKMGALIGVGGGMLAGLAAAALRTGRFAAPHV